MAIVKAISSKAGIGTAIDYVSKDEKTEEKLMSGIGCTPQTAKEEMQVTKQLWNKTDGRQYKHYTISYAPEEKITPKQAHKNAMELVKDTKAFEGFEVLVATHVDRKHIHSHIIVNSVNVNDGHKLQCSRRDLADLKERTNEQSRQQGLNVPEKGKHFDGSRNDDTTTWNKNKYKTMERAFSGDYPSYVLNIANAVADVRRSSRSRTEFVNQMRERGYDTEWKDTHKNITFTDIERKQRGETRCKVRNSNLTKTFKADFGKESLENEFQRNAERYRATERAREQLQSGTDTKAIGQDSGVGTNSIDVTIINRQAEISNIKSERRERELARIKQEREKTQREKLRADKEKLRADKPIQVTEHKAERKAPTRSRGIER